MPSKINEYLKKAEYALQKGDQKAAVSLLNQVLQQDFNNAEAWQLLYNLHGQSDSFDSFQKKYIQKHFPQKLSETNRKDDKSIRRVSLTGGKKSAQRDKKLQQTPDPENKPVQKEKKPGFFARLFGIFRRKPKAAPEPDLAKPLPPTPTESKPSVRPTPLKPTAPTPSLREELAITPPAPATLTPPPLSSFREVPESPTDEKIRVLVVDDIAQTRENLIKLLSLEPSIQVVGGARTGGEGVSMTLLHDPHVVLMDINMPDMDGLEATRLVRSKVPYVQIVILTVQDDPSYMREAIVAGARDFLVKPPMVEELISAVKRAYVIAREEKARMPPPMPVGYPAITPPIEVNGSKRIISVYAPKGGVGCTTLASNLAVTLHSDTTPAIIVDSRLHFGGVGISFNERSKHSLGDLTPRVEHLDPEVVNGVVTTHTGSGVRILLAPEKISDAESIDASQVGPLLNYLSTIYTYVIVDTSSELSEHTLAVLDASGLVLLATSQDIPSLDRVRRFLELAPAIGLNKDRFRLILSRFNEKINITPERISQNFKQDIAGVIPNDSSVVSPATNQGTPFMMDKRLKGRPIHKAFTDLARMIEKETEVVKA